MKAGKCLLVKAGHRKMISPEVETIARAGFPESAGNHGRAVKIRGNARIIFRNLETKYNPGAFLPRWNALRGPLRPRKDATFLPDF
jgi:hypothetical protein